MGDGRGFCSDRNDKKTWVCVGSERRRGRYETFL
jgi:hypothetical protein